MKIQITNIKNQQVAFTDNIVPMVHFSGRVEDLDNFVYYIHLITARRQSPAISYTQDGNGYVAISLRVINEVNGLKDAIAKKIGLEDSQGFDNKVLATISKQDSKDAKLVDNTNNQTAILSN